jgi:hypothetical protein
MAKIYAHAKPEEVDLKVSLFILRLCEDNYSCDYSGQGSYSRSAAKHRHYELHYILPALYVNTVCAS